MYEKIVIYVSRIQDIQNKIQDLNYIRSQLEIWIDSDYYPEFIVAKFYSLINQIDEILRSLHLMLAEEKYNYFFSNDYFIEISLIPFVLIYPYPVSIIADLFDTISEYQDYDNYEDDEDSLFYNLLEIFSDYISSIDDTSTDSDGDDIANELARTIMLDIQQKNNKITKKNKIKP